MTTIIKKGKTVLRPRARIIRIIGEELISNDMVAIVELVKNSYDADAKKVEIKFNEPLKEGFGSIIIRDDGSGMDLETVKKGWMEPASTTKAEKRKSRKGRKLLGKKGIGRFASAKLSKKLYMTTKTKEDNEIHSYFNWEHFKNDKKYLDEIECEWEVRKPESIQKHGTLLVLNELNSDWNEKKLEKLKTHLSRLISPFEIKAVEDFEIELILPKEFENISGLINPPESLGRPDYRIKGNVNINGEVTFIYESRKTGEKPQAKEDVILRKPTRKPKCGQFEFEFRVWDIGEKESRLRDVKRDLKEVGGISIYRDGFRVAPYGEPKNDWLGLDIRRVNNPTQRLSNNQITGYVSISLEKNPVLVDQSNREGIVESQEFEDIKESIKDILSRLENERYNERPREGKEVKNILKIFSKISLDPVIEIVNKRLPEDKEAQQIVKNTDNSIKEGIKQAQEVISRYRRLSTLGLLIDVLLHDGNNILLRLDNEVLLLEKELNKKSGNGVIFDHLKNIQLERKALSKLFERLEPFGGRKRGRPKTILLENAIKNVFELFKIKILELNVETRITEGETKVTFDESDLQMIFVNLLDNSLYWLDNLKQKEKKITVEITETQDELQIIFSDNGPGVKNEDAERIFEPYFSRKPDGIGLGLTIAGELIEEYGGYLELISNGPLEGVSFRIKLIRGN